MSAQSVDKVKPAVFSWSLLAPRCWPTWIGLGLLRLLVVLPHRLQLKIGAGLGRALRRAMGSRVRVARVNLELCFPERSATEREQWIDECFRSLGVMVLEIGFAWWGSARRHRPLYRVRGLERIEAITGSGQGVLLLFCHFTTLELTGRMLAYHMPMAALYREHSDPVLEYVVRRQRLRYGEGLFNRNELRGMVKYLRGGGVLWYAPDQDYQRGEHVFAPFFGVPAATTVSTHQLARMGRARVLVTQNRRLADGSYELVIRDLLSELPTDDVEHDCRRINQAVETLVRDCPGQYLWIHRRFKTRPAGEPPVY